MPNCESRALSDWVVLFRMARVGVSDCLVQSVLIQKDGSLSFWARLTRWPRSFENLRWHIGTGWT